MKTIFAFSLFVLITLVSGSLANTKLISKLQTSLTHTEMTLSDVEPETLVDPKCLLFFGFIFSSLVSSYLKVPARSFSVDLTLKPNPTLNPLYRAHAPPAL